MSDSRSTVFVYGTLKRGGSNHEYLAGQFYLGKANTVAGFTLYSLGDYPGLVVAPFDEDGVTGELWSVDAPTLAALDCLEGVNEGLYVREPVKLAPPHDTIEPMAHVYRYLGLVAGRPHLGPSWAE